MGSHGLGSGNRGQGSCVLVVHLSVQYLPCNDRDKRHAEYRWDENDLRDGFIEELMRLETRNALTL